LPVAKYHPRRYHNTRQPGRSPTPRRDTLRKIGLRLFQVDTLVFGNIGDKGLPEIIMSIEKGRLLAIATFDADPGEADTSFSSELDHFLSQSKQIVKQEAMKLAGLGQSMRMQTVRSGLLQ
jgi:hypothetical protein